MGATGLEPATSGVTGRYGATGYNRLRPGITGWSRHFATMRTGCDRLRPATTRHSLCSTRVVGLVSGRATLHHHRGNDDHLPGPSTNSAHYVHPTDHRDELLGVTASGNDLAGSIPALDITSGESVCGSISVSRAPAAARGPSRRVGMPSSNARVPLEGCDEGEVAVVVLRPPGQEADRSAGTRLPDSLCK
jgi:hypothetical protein